VTDASIGRAASGARLLGDDVQHLIAWYHVLCSQRVDSHVTSIAVEASNAGNVDDLTMELDDGSTEYWQVKASVDARTPLTEGWLFEHKANKRSLLQRLYSSWVAVRGGGQPPRIVLATTKSIEPDDAVLSYRATTDCSLSDTLRAASFTGARQRWAEHLDITEDELMLFLDHFELLHGQSEKEWRTKVNDAAYGAGVLRTDSAVALGMQQVRDWVKTPRRVLTPERIAEIITDLGIRDVSPRLLVAQALELNPRASSATYASNWVDLFDGDDPRNRRVLKDHGSTAVIKADLVQARHKLRAAGVTDLEVAGPMRLPLWFTVGSELGATAGFALSAAAGDEVWSSKAVPDPNPACTVVQADSRAPRAYGRPWVVSVNVAFDIRADVSAFAAAALPGALMMHAVVDEPGSRAVHGPEHAMGIAAHIRDELRRLRADLRPEEVHLFLATPSALALFLGSLWDRMPPTTVYWDLGQPGAYAPAFCIDN
jgi:hypothetical protein